MTDRGWFAAGPSGTEDVYKIYPESFVSEGQLGRIQAEAQSIVDEALKDKKHRRDVMSRVADLAAISNEVSSGGTARRKPQG